MVYKYGFSDNQSLEGYYNNFAMSHFDVNDFQEQSIPDVIKPEFGVVTECRYTHLIHISLDRVAHEFYTEPKF